MEVLEQAKIVSPYSDDRGSYSHTGVDVLSNTGNRNVRVVAKGKVIEIQNRMEDSYIVNQGSPVSEWAGNYVVIEHGNGYVSRYNHLKYNSINVQIGDIVEEGHEFAQEGESGYATGVHLDFEVKLNGKFVDPTAYALGEASLPAYEDPKPTPQGQFLNLEPSYDGEPIDSWRIYDLDVQPVVGNEKAKINPAQFGGLSYLISELKGDIAIIETDMYGMCQIYINHPACSITDSPKFEHGKY